ncbi:MAG TPA: amidohydrolase family protein [Vineibacter sp.]|nr:amidohydrolase family protein [Vineibacter sp.]
MKKRAAAMAAALLLAPAAFADTLVDNVNGYTLDRQGALVRFTGLVIDDGDGTVKQLLARKDKRPERPSYRLDGRGRTLIPGMIDAHGHVMELGFLTLQLDLRGTASLAEAQAKIAAYAAANPSPRWIVGFGWDQEKWGLGRFPTAAELDAAVADRPVWLQRVDGHAGWANSAALKEAGVGPASQSPPGGRIERTGKQPSGVFVDAAMELVHKAVPPPLPRVRDQALANAQALLLGAGITSVADMGTDTDGWMVMRRAGDRGALDLRIISYGLGVDTALAVAGTGPTPWLYGGRLRMIGVKLSADGALGSRGAWLKSDYRDAPGQRGTPFHNDAELKNLMSRAAMDRFQLAVDAVGDAANAQLLDAIDELSGTYDGDRRWRIEHAELVDPADLPRFGRHGIVASMQPVLAASSRPMAEARVDPVRLTGAYAWASMLQNRVPLAFGSNFPVDLPNPFAGLAAAVSREDAQGRPAGGWMPQQKLTLAQAFAAFTRGGAYAAFEENRLGTLERGHLADFLFIDRDIFADGMTPQAISGTNVLETWVGGRKEWAKGGAAATAVPPKPTTNQEHR